MLITLSRRTAICQSFAKVKLSSIAFLETVILFNFLFGTHSDFNISAEWMIYFELTIPTT